MSRFWGKALCSAWCFALFGGCLLPEVSSPPETATTTVESSEPPPAETPPVQEAPPPESPPNLASDASVDPSAADQLGTAGMPAAKPAAAGSGGMSAPATVGGGGKASASEPCFRCDGALLRRCDDAPDAKPIAECTSRRLCDAKAGKCLTVTCERNTSICKDNVLLTCNARGNDYEETICGTKICSAKHGRCNLCAQSAECDGDILVECDETGQGYKRTRCPASTPYCRRNRCIECVSHDDCGPVTAADSCIYAWCDVGTGVCETKRNVDGGCTIHSTGEQGLCNANSVCIP